jgi:GDP-L-fucose synthase
MVGRNVLEHPAAAQHEWLCPTRRELDLCDRAAVLAYMVKARPDVVVHAAGKVGGIQANIASPVAFLVENLDMGTNVVLAAASGRVPRLLNLGSSCMYPKDHDEPLREELVLGGPLEPTNEGYAIAKCAVARLCSYMARQDPELRYKTLIPCNLYGRWDSFDPVNSHMAPAVIRKLHEATQRGATAVEVWGDGTARREFLYAGDLAACIQRCLVPAHFDALPELMNVGLGHDHTVDDYYRAAATVVGYRGGYRHDPSKPSGMKRKLVAIDRQLAWGFRADTDLATGLRHTYQYFLEREQPR